MTSKKDDAQSPVREIKNVLILMPFQSGSTDGEKTSHLQKTRIKYIVEDLINIRSRTYPGSFIQYKANIVNTGVGDIETIVEQQFEKTDLFIALLSKSNVNVIFEVAILNVLQQNLVLLMDSDIKSQNIPIYLKGYAFINFYAGDGGKAIKGAIEGLSHDQKYKIYGDDKYSNDQEIDFIKKIDEQDGRLVEILQESIYKYENGEVAPPLSFRKLVRDVHPSNALSTWNTLIPMCVLKAKWKPTKDGSSEYDGIDSLIEDPHVTTCNSYFVRILGSAIDKPNDFIEAHHKLTAEKQLKMFSKYVSKKNYAAFLEDQGEVFQKLFIQDLPAKATVPLEFKSGRHEHPDSEFNGKVYLPILISKKVVGIRSSPHTTYYVIAYVEDFLPFDENEHKNNK